MEDKKGNYFNGTIEGLGFRVGIMEKKMETTIL